MPVIKLLVSLQGRENGEKRTLLPGWYNTEDSEFPSMLVGETRPGVVELPDSFVWEESDNSAELEESSETEEKPVRRKKAKQE